MILAGSQKPGLWKDACPNGEYVCAFTFQQLIARPDIYLRGQDRLA
jgi:hypothetical protein